MGVIYTVGIYLYGLAIWLVSLFQQKARLWIKGRKNWEARLGEVNLTGCIWIHCASLGEFEQGRPLLEALRLLHPARPILLTFFSPSGYEVRKNYAQADCVAYLPLDTPSNASRFLEITKPAVAIFVKYEVWHNFYSAIKKDGIPLFMVSAIFRSSQIYFKPYGKWFRKSLQICTRIFTQDSESSELLRSIGINHTEVAGDTRFDRVIEISNTTQTFPELAPIRKKNLVIVAGSTWPPDEEILLKFVEKHPEIHLVLAPHETDPERITKLAKGYSQALTWTNKSQITEDTSIVIIDQIGLLSSLYKYADIAYVGGGFGSGIHNTLEPAVFGIPVIFGSEFAKFKEARELISVNGAASISSYDEFEDCMEKLIANFDLRKTMGRNAGAYVIENAGATRHISTVINDTLSF